MKNRKNIILLSLLLIVTTVLTGCGKKAELKNGAEVAVKTKNSKITATEYYEEIKEDNIETLISKIDKSFLLKDIKTTDDENKMVKDQINKIKDVYGKDPDTYTKFIQQYFGADNEKELEENLRLEYKRNEAVKRHISKNLSDHEIKKYYKDNIYGEIKASHILIKPDVKENASEDEIKEAEKVALKKANEIIEKLKKGKDFSKLAEEYSDDTATKEKGGDLGYFQPSDMVDEFKDAVIELKKGKYTIKPVKSKFGYHIILKVDEKPKKKLDKVKKEIKEKLTEEKLNNDNTLYYEALKDIRADKGLTWKDKDLEKSYNKYMDRIIESIKDQNK